MVKRTHAALYTKYYGLRSAAIRWFRHPRERWQGILKVAVFFQMIWCLQIFLKIAYVGIKDSDIDLIRPARLRSIARFASADSMNFGGPKNKIEKLCGVRASSWLEFSVSNCDVESPLLVVGCGHSGTSVLRDLLGFHSQIYDVEGETNFANEEKSPCSIFLSATKFSIKCDRAGKRRWMEKTPRHILRLSTIFDVLPRARIVLMVRDGRDVAHSLFKRYQYQCDTEIDHGREECERGVFTRTAIGRWVGDNAAAEDYRGDERVLVVRYEDFVNDPENILGMIFDHVDLPNERVIDRRNEALVRRQDFFLMSPILSDQLGIESDPNHDAYRARQLAEPITTRHLGKWRKGLTDDQIDLFKETRDAQEMLIRYGYEHSFDWGRYGS